ncbi:MAG: putative phytochrome sensor protein [Phycisphaerales bacterium]|nr:putative phytochrome sensor protein [Phycisphaerales bacterium]
MKRKQRRARKPSTLATVAIVGATIATLYFAQDVLIPIAISVLLAFLLARPVSWCERQGAGRVTSVVSVVAVAFLIIVGLGYVVGQQLVGLADNLSTYQDNITNKVKALSGTGSGLGHKLEKLSQDIQQASENAATKPAATQPATQGVVAQAAEEISSDPSRAAAREIVQGPPTTAPSALGATPRTPIYVTQAESGSSYQTLMTFLEKVGGPLGTASLVVVFVVFILIEREAMRDRFIAIISRGNYITTTRAINDAAERISRYLLAQSIVNGSYGLIIGIGLFVIGLIFGHGVWFPSFVLWALLCAILRFIPYLGPAVSSLFPVALALAVYPGFTVAVAVIALFLVVELISNNVMEPWLYGASTGLSTVAIILAAVFWTWLWGSIGLLVATPLTVCIAVVGKYVKPLNFLHVLLGDEEALPPSVGYYQRLLAGDRRDAERVVDRVIEMQGLATTADTVYIPALRMARRDRADEELSAETENQIFDDTLAIARRVPEGAETGEQASTEPLSVLACPAHDRADEITLEVLASMLSPMGVHTKVMSTRALPADVEASVERDSPAVVVIAILPPGGLPQARYLCRRLRRKFPDLPILIGYWGKARSFDRLLVRFRNAGASYVLTSIEQTRAQIGAMLPKPAAMEPTVESTTTPS